MIYAVITATSYTLLNIVIKTCLTNSKVFVASYRPRQDIQGEPKVGEQ